MSDLDLELDLIVVVRDFIEDRLHLFMYSKKLFSSGVPVLLWIALFLHFSFPLGRELRIL